MGKRLLHRCLRSGGALSLSSSPWSNIMSKSTKTQLTAKQLQAKLDLFNRSYTSEKLAPVEIEEVIKDPRCTKKQLSRVLMAISFGMFNSDSEFGWTVIQTLPDRKDFESLIEDFEFESRFARACAVLDSNLVSDSINALLENETSDDFENTPILYEMKCGKGHSRVETPHNMLKYKIVKCLHCEMKAKK